MASEKAKEKDPTRAWYNQNKVYDQVLEGIRMPRVTQNCHGRSSICAAFGQQHVHMVNEEAAHRLIAIVRKLVVQQGCTEVPDGD